LWLSLLVEAILGKMIGLPTNKAGTPFISFLLFKVEGILVVVEGFLLKNSILILMEETLLKFRYGFGFNISFGLYIVYFELGFSFDFFS